MLTAQSLACAAPPTVGFSVNYLISASFVEQDTSPAVLSYYNASNPTQAFSGPGNTGAAQTTTRQDTVQLWLTPGIAATTGSQTTPATPVGTIPLWVVTVANGQTTITSASIAQAAGAPILTSSLLQAIQADTLTYGVDVGTVNVVQATYQLPITSLVENMNLWVRFKNTNTGSMTFTPAPGLIGPLPVVGGNHQLLQGGEAVANGRGNLVYRADITSWVLMESSGGAMQVAPATQNQQALNLGQFASSVNSSGYQKFPNGTILQWGVVTVASGGGVATFPIAFPNACYGVVATSNGSVSSTNFAANVGASSKTSVTIYGTVANTAAAASFSCFYYAFGN